MRHAAALAHLLAQRPADAAALTKDIAAGKPGAYLPRVDAQATLGPRLRSDSASFSPDQLAIAMR
jgi:hypothetical protein